MASRIFTPNFAGYREILSSEPGVQAMIASKTAAVGQHVRDDVPPRVSNRVLDGVLQTDRPQGNVTIAIRSGEAMEGKHGYLSRAAAAAGFEGLKRKGG